MNNTWKKIMAFAVASCLGCASLFMLGGCGESGGADDPNDPQPGGGIEWPPPGDKPSEDEDGGGTEDRAVTFSDEFDGGEISSAWEFQIGTGTNYGLVDWGNGEAQYYRRENASLEDGALKITLKRESYGGKDYTSARLRTKGSFSQTYGRFEARIKIDGGAGVWPAFWLMPENDEYGAWPYSGEIDIMEIKGRKQDMSSSAVHFAASGGEHQYKTSEDKLPDGGTIDDYHVYALEWEPDKMTFYVDDVPHLVVDDWQSGTTGFPAPYDKDFHIILNLACGGHFDGYILPDNDELPAAMYVDYVKVYEPL